METLTAYVISAGIIGFGVWIVADTELGRGSMLACLVVGMAPIAVGVASVANEMHNDRHA